jgi:hypothetical protein
VTEADKAGQLDSPSALVAVRKERDALGQRYISLLNSITNERSKLYARERRTAGLQQAASQSSGAGAKAKGQELQQEIEFLRSKRQQLDAAYRKAREAERLLPRH